MPVAIATAVDIMTATFDSKEREVINAPVITNTKTLGNIPRTTNASQMVVGNNTTEGVVINFDLADGASVSATVFDASVETKILVCSWQFNAPNRFEQGTMAAGGYMFRLTTGTGNANFREWVLSGIDAISGFFQKGANAFVIDMNASADHNDDGGDTGTYDNTDIQAYGVTMTSVTEGGTTSLTFLQALHVFDTDLDGTDIVKFTGTSDFDDIIDAVLGTTKANATGAWVQRLSAAYFIPVAFQIGDASTATNFNDNGVTVISPATAVAADTDPRFRLTTQAMRVYVRLRDNAADDVTLTGTYVWGTAAPWDFNFDNLGDVFIALATFRGMGDFTLGGSVTGGAAFDLAAGSDVIIEGANLNGSVINGDVQLNTATNLTDITISGDLRITTGADSTLTFDNVTVLGDVFNDSAGNTLTINSVNGSSLSTTEPGTGNGQVNILNAVTVRITVVEAGSPIEGAFVQLIATETVGTITIDDILLEGLTNASGIVEDTTFNYESAFDPSGLDFDISIAKGSEVPTYIRQTGSGVILPAGFAVTVFMVSDD